jgi:hypothetical protein
MKSIRSRVSPSIVRAPRSLAKASVLSLAALSGVAACSANAGTAAEDLGQAAEKVVYGTPEVPDQSGVVLLQSPVGLCSGVLLTNFVVLTAKHCVVDAKGAPITPSSILATMGGEKARGALVFPHPTLDAAIIGTIQTFTMGGSKVGWLQLVDFTPTPALVGQQVKCWGYGFNDPLETAGLGILRSAPLTVQSVTPTSFYEVNNAAGQQLASGDSGGPCFLGASGGSASLLEGIVSNGVRDVDGTQVASAGLLDFVGRVPGYPGFNRSGPPGIDPVTSYDYCAGAAVMCGVQRLPEYTTLAAQCRALNWGDVPQCDFPDPAPVCAAAATACASGDATAWTAREIECSGLGGPVPPCGMGLTLSVAPSVRYVKLAAGDAKGFDVATQGFGNVAGVSFDVSGLPAGVTASVGAPTSSSASGINPSAHVTLYAGAGVSLSGARQMVNVNARYGGQSQTSELDLEVAACQPKTAAQACGGLTCGGVPDGCGGTVTCGTCGAGQVCNGGTCGACVPLTCASAGATCGAIADGCGGTLACGSCAVGQYCVAHRCSACPAGKTWDPDMQSCVRTVICVKGLCGD